MYGAPAPADEVLQIARGVRDRGLDLDEETTRWMMRMVGIDPGPVWDRPLHPYAKRRPIRPAARIQFEAMLQTQDPLEHG
jgi:hypothetical protein